MPATSETYTSASFTTPSVNAVLAVHGCSTLPIAKRTDLQLLSDYCNYHDVMAIDCLWRRYASKVRAQLRKFVKGNTRVAENPDSAYDMAIVNMINSYRENPCKFIKEDLSGYIFISACNIIKDELKRKYIKSSVNETQYMYSDDDTTRSRLANTSNGDLIPDEILVNKELKEEILDAIESLPPKQRQSVYDRYVSELNSKEICEIYGIADVNVVNSRIFEGTKALKKKLKDVYDDLFHSNMRHSQSFLCRECMDI